MDIDKFQLMLSLQRPGYVVESGHCVPGSPLSDVVWARIAYTIGVSDINQAYKELVDDSHFIFFARGQTHEDAIQQVIKKWTSRNLK